jgi:hypothetical protein
MECLAAADDISSDFKNITVRNMVLYLNIYQFKISFLTSCSLGIHSYRENSKIVEGK